MNHYVLMNNGAKITISKAIYEKIQKMFTRGADRTVLMENGDILRSQFVVYLGTEPTGKGTPKAK